MATIQLKNVPDTLHAELRRRAKQGHMSLRDYVLDLIVRDQVIPSKWDWLERVRALPVTRLSKSAAEIIREERETWETRGRRR